MKKSEVARHMALAGMMSTMSLACDYAAEGSDETPIIEIYEEFLSCYIQAWNDDPLRASLRRARIAREHHHA
jgi:hypothetical protein